MAFGAMLATVVIVISATVVYSVNVAEDKK